MAADLDIVRAIIVADLPPSPIMTLDVEHLPRLDCAVGWDVGMPAVEQALLLGGWLVGVDGYNGLVSLLLRHGQ